MTIRDSLKADIARARRQKEAVAQTELAALIHKGAHQEAMENLVFFAAPGSGDSPTHSPVASS